MRGRPDPDAKGRVADKHFGEKLLSRHRVQVIWSHPRTNSLTAAIVNDVAEELRQAGAEIDLLDLYRDEFCSSLREADEPDWDNPEKQYSKEVIHHATRTKSADVVFFVFPVWWFSFPAIMKGYLDRVWNHGLFYGSGRKAGIQKVRWIGLAGESSEFFAKRSYDTMIEHHLNIGIAGFCGIEDSHVELLYDTFANETEDASSHYSNLRQRARQIARTVMA
jgi:NAD(P)H dehydrogenase (quinone)